MTEDVRKRAAEKERELRRQLRALSQARKGTASAGRSAYESHKDRAAARAAELSESGRDIGQLPAVVDPARKASAANSFLTFCQSYFPATFFLPFSDDHRRVLAAVELSVRTGGLYAFAMPRGSGKTSIVETAALWALLYGYRDFVAIVGSDEDHAKTMLDSIKVECETNERLLEDFPEAVYPIVALENIHQRAKGQLYKGRPTNIEWTASEVQFPTIPGSKASGGIIRVAGITGRIRGMSAKRASDGRKARPSLVLVDDPQTDESAASPAQVQTREGVLKGAILGLAGPGAKISGLATITVIRPDDLADRLLDRARHPSWQGERTRLVYDWPTAEELWGQYAELRRQGQRDGTGTGAADDFYAANRDAMDAGARVAWPERRNDDELSAIQHAWNLRIDRGESAFLAEYQNQPMSDDIATDKLDKRGLATRVTTLERGKIPLDHQTLTAFVDVQEKLLFWLVASWNQSFGGHVVAYGCYPDQASSFFEAKYAKRTLANAAKGAGFEGALSAGLEAVAKMLLGRDWQREDGANMRIGQMLIDANWGQSTSTVRTFCRRTPFAGVVLPSHGKGIGASSKPLAEKRGRGDRIGLNWRVGQMSEGQRSAMYDTNYWKTFVAARLKLAMGDPEALGVHAGDHDLLWEHLTSEFPVRAESRGRVVDEWKAPPGADNHWWDCLVGAAVAASIAGVQPVATEAAGRQRRKVAIPEASSGRRVITLKKFR